MSCKHTRSSADVRSRERAIPFISLYAVERMYAVDRLCEVTWGDSMNDNLRWFEFVHRGSIQGWLLAQDMRDANVRAVHAIGEAYAVEVPSGHLDVISSCFPGFRPSPVYSEPDEKLPGVRWYKF